MTIIAVKDGVMAADSGEFQGGLVTPASEPKIVRSKFGELFGGAGKLELIRMVRAWFLAGELEDRKPSLRDGDFSALILRHDGVAWRVDSTLIPYPQGRMAVCGNDTAEAVVFGAMDAGADAARAVEIACERCAWVRGPVQVERVDVEIRPT